jgi:hypothetical protein
VSDAGRDGITGARARGAIGFSAIRGGDIVGEHDVMFAGAGERIVLRHIASDRAIFARGALKAALWGQGKPPGAYTMASVSPPSRSACLPPPFPRLPISQRSRRVRSSNSLSRGANCAGSASGWW